MHLLSGAHLFMRRDPLQTHTHTQSRAHSRCDRSHSTGDTITHTRPRNDNDNDDGDRNNDGRVDMGTRASNKRQAAEELARSARTDNHPMQYAHAHTHTGTFMQI